VAVLVGSDVVDAAVGHLEGSGDFHLISLVGAPGSCRLRGEAFQGEVELR
jgi:hypothetical protein